MQSSFSGGRIADASKETISQPLPSNLRPLPGYSVKKPHAPTATPTPQVASTPITTGKYQTRERLYYEAESATATAAGLHTTNEAFTKPQPVLSRLTEDAPPSLSLYEYGAITPERKYAESQEEIHPKPETIIPPLKMTNNLMDIDDSLGKSVESLVCEDNWVTVFGFAGSQASDVAAYFNRLGSVERHEVGQGNWMHFKYSTLWAAQKALVKNGTILPLSSGSCMIGVIPAQRAMDQVSIAATSFMSPLKRESMRKKSIDPNVPQEIFIKPGYASPLATQSFDPNRRNLTVDKGDVFIKDNPSGATSLATKVFGYFFGW